MRKFTTHYPYSLLSSIMTIFSSSDETGKNMKRESRVYSYKEQLEEIQLRKELEEKRRQTGKPIIYSNKQKEAIKVQMGKEKVIRDNVARVSKTWNGLYAFK